MKMNYRILHQLSAMNKLFFITTALLGGSLTVAGQTNVVVAASKMNVLYIGVDNPVTVAASDASDKNVSITIRGGNGTISKTGAGLYNVRVATLTDDCLLDVYVDGKLTATSQFRVRRLPQPFATIGGLTSGSKAVADVFKAQSGLGIYVKDSPFEVKYEVTSYTIKLEDSQGNLLSADCQGALFSPLAKQYLEQYAKTGNIVTIESIRAKDDIGRELKIPSVFYYIK
jgi:hypothetical protein